jgi:hypothetical protein
MPKNEGAKGNPGGQGAPIVPSPNGSAQPPTLAEIGISYKQPRRSAYQLVDAADVRDTLCAIAHKLPEKNTGTREPIGTQQEPIPEPPTLADMGISYKKTEVLADLEALPKAPKVAAFAVLHFDELLWLNYVMGTRQLRRVATTVELC